MTPFSSTPTDASTSQLPVLALNTIVVGTGSLAVVFRRFNRLEQNDHKLGSGDGNNSSQDLKVSGIVAMPNVPIGLGLYDAPHVGQQCRYGCSQGPMYTITFHENRVLMGKKKATRYLLKRAINRLTVTSQNGGSRQDICGAFTSSPRLPRPPGPLSPAYHPTNLLHPPAITLTRTRAINKPANKSTIADRRKCGLLLPYCIRQ